MPKNTDPVQPVPGWNGFYDPNYTPVPDDFFDVLLAHLTDVEVRVLLYIIRRTYGFKKRSDAISLSQITDGIVTSDGRRLDYGAGVKKDGAIAAVRRLEARGIIITQRHQSAARGHEPTTYTLRMNGTPLSSPPTRVVVSTDKGSRGEREALVASTDKQEDREQEDREQEDSNLLTLHEKEKSADRPPYSPYIGGVIYDLSGELGDASHATSNVTQALRLWQQSGWDEDAFVAACQTTRRTVRQAQAHGVGNKMAYFFAALRRELGLT